MDEKRGIGKDNKIPWHIKEDLIRLKGLTKDHTVILGRKTYDSMVWYYNRSGNPMPGKLYVVITRDEGYKPARENAMAAHSFEEALKIAGDQDIYPSVSAVIPDSDRGSSNLDSRFHGNDNEEIFIIGGGQIFQQALPLADKLYLTIVKGDYDCDTFFPDYGEFKKVVSEESKESEGHRYRFLEVER